LPLLLNALPGKVERSSAVSGIELIKNLHQFITTGPRRVFIEQVELGYPLTEEITQHNAGFLVPVAILPDFVQALYRGVNDVA